MNKQSGFNLIEVLIALMVIAVAVGASVTLATSATRNVVLLEQSMLANWVGLNQISLAQLAKEGEGENHGDVEMGGQHWYWTQTIKPTEQEADLLEIVIQVFDKESTDSAAPVATVKGFRAL